MNQLKKVKKSVRDHIDILYRDYETFNIFKLIELLGVNIRYFDDTEFDIKVSGFAIKNTIYVNKNIPEGLYHDHIVGHELGHIVMHWEHIQLFPLNFNERAPKLEREANDFALALLALNYEMNIETLRLKLADVYKVYV